MGDAAVSPAPAAQPHPANFDTWNSIADFWDATLGEGNDMFLQLLLPAVEELADVGPGHKVLDLGTGNGILARRLARDGVDVTAVDFSASQLANAKKRTEKAGKVVAFSQLDLTSNEALDAFADLHKEEFDVITASMLLKELEDLHPLAEFIPKVLKRTGRVVMANLHPCFHKPGAHRVVEVIENPETGVQEFHSSIKVAKYLTPRHVQSQALRGQPTTLIWFHRPIQDLLNPFFDAHLAVTKVRELAFQDGADPKQIQSYHNFPEIPLQFIFTLCRVP